MANHYTGRWTAIRFKNAAKASASQIMSCPNSVFCLNGNPRRVTSTSTSDYSCNSQPG